MKITNVRVLNNYKVKLINTKLSGVNSFQNIVGEQGTRTPVIITETPSQEFQEKFNRVLDYLINRYEPQWSGVTQELGKLATMQLLGVSGPLNPLTLGGTVEAAFNGTTASDVGWFDIFTNPREFATVVKNAYKVYGRARQPKKAKHRFMSYNTNGIGEYSSQIGKDGGNMFLGANKDMVWYPEPTSKSLLYLGLNENYGNSIERQLLHSPYAVLRSPMFSTKNRQSLPWISDRYAPAEGWVFDQYLLMRESTTLRDLLTDHTVSRVANLGVSVNGVYDSNINTLYRGSSYPDGVYSVILGSRTGGGYSANQVFVGSPWITYTAGLTWNGNFFDASISHGLCFDTRTLTLFDGTTFPEYPPTITDRAVEFKTGISYGYGERRLSSLNYLSDQWGNSMEFTLYLGMLPYGISHEQHIPWMLYKDPTVGGNKDYFKWRLDASVKHAKQKFLSPIDGFAHIIQDSATDIERTYHRYDSVGYTAWTNVLPSGVSYVENIPVEWARDQYRYTYGSSGPDATNGIVYGVDGLNWNEWQYSSSDTAFKKSQTDSSPRHWCLDEDIAASLHVSVYDFFMGQRYNGLTLTNQIWGKGVCGGSTLGEMLAVCTLSEQSGLDAYPFLYNTFIEHDGSALRWKGVTGTSYTNGSTVPWCNDRRFTLFYLYPTVLALGGTIVDHFHDGIGYYSTESRWFDKSLGSIFTNDMETLSIGTVVSDTPFAGRRTPTKPPQNFWTGIARTSEFELLYACMKAGITTGLESLYFNELYEEIRNGNISTPKIRIYLNELPIEDRANEFASYGTKRYGIVYQNDVDPNAVTGVINTTLLKAALDGSATNNLMTFPTFNLVDTVYLDYEEPYSAVLRYGTEYGTGTHNGVTYDLASIRQTMTDAINEMKTTYPNKRWGYYAMPQMNIWITDSGTPVSDTRPDQRLLHQATTARRQANITWLANNADVIAQASDIVGSDVYQHDIKDNDIEGLDSLDPEKTKDAVAMAKIFKNANPNIETTVWVSPQIFKNAVVAKSTVNSGVSDWSFLDINEIISDQITPAIQSGVDSITLWLPIGFQFNLMFTATFAASNPYYLSQQDIRASYAKKFLEPQGIVVPTIQPTIDAFWTATSTKNIIKESLHNYHIELCSLIQATANRIQS